MDSINLRYEIEAGDLILFNRNCSSMSILPSSICFGAKLSSYSNYDHIGIVVENPNDPKQTLYLLEANMNGITCKLLSDRILKSKSNQFCIRKVMSSNKTKEWKSLLWNVANDKMNSKYNSSITDMTKAVLTSFTNDFNTQISKSNYDFNYHLQIDYDFQQNSNKLNLLDKLLNMSKKQSIPPDNDLELEYNHESLSKYFCSQLVSEILVLMGVLNPSRHFSTYLPSDFSSTCIKHQLTLNNKTTELSPHNWYLSPDLVINKSDKFTISTENNKFIVESIAKPPSYTFSVSDVLPNDITKQLFDHRSYMLLSPVVDNKINSCRFFNKSINYPNELHLHDNINTFDIYKSSDMLLTNNYDDFSLIAKGQVVLSPTTKTNNVNVNANNYEYITLDVNEPSLRNLLNVNDKITNNKINGIRVKLVKGDTLSMAFNHGSLFRENLVVVLSGRFYEKSNSTVSPVNVLDHPIVLNPLILVGILEPFQLKGNELEAVTDCEILLIDRNDLIKKNIAISPVDWNKIINNLKISNDNNLSDNTILNCLNYFTKSHEKELFAMLAIRLSNILYTSENVSQEHLLGIICLLTQLLNFPTLSKSNQTLNYNILNITKINEYHDVDNHNRQILNLFDHVLNSHLCDGILQDIYRHRFDLMPTIKINQKYHLRNSYEIKDDRLSIMLIPISSMLWTKVFATNIQKYSKNNNWKSNSKNIELVIDFYKYIKKFIHKI